jgi:hypothetical protein
MESPDDNKTQQPPVLAIMSICLALLGVVVPKVAPLDSSRPAMPDKAMSMGWRGIEDVESRLWQDPFKAVSEHALPNDSGPNESYTKYAECYDKPNHHDFSALKVCIEKLSKDTDGHKNPKILILGILAPGGPYAEDAEFRMRTRYAVLSGLASEGFFPTDSKHIGFFMGKPVISKLPERIPFEWLEQEKLKNHANDENISKVLLIWLDEEIFETKPLETASLLKDSFIHNLNVKSDTVLFRFLGPSRSDTLLAMAEELKDLNNRHKDIHDLVEKIRNATEKINPESDEKKQNVNIETSEALKQKDDTLDALDVSDALKKKLEEIGRPYESIKKLAQTFVNVAASIDPQNYTDMKEVVTELPIRATLTDTNLADAILTELRLRGVKLTCEDAQNYKDCKKNIDHIVLISEWDTFYGREAFPTALKNSIAILTCEKNTSKKECANGIYKLDQFSYMRGLDGAIPSESKIDDKNKAGNLSSLVNGAKKFSSKDQDGQFNETVMERPEGQSQKDYLRRLGDQIAYYNQALLDKGEKGIRAIGVVGSDAYDKLMVLKALRPNFPGTLFFTTDLDARLTLPDEIEHTRNLIVASSFGLELNQSLQKKIPPFRDSYQTGYFLATKLLVCKYVKDSQANINPELNILRNCIPQDDNKLEEGKNDRQNEIDKLLSPARIFELGLSRQPFNLNEACEGPNYPESPCTNVHPKKSTILFTDSFWIPFGLVFISCAIGIVFSSKLHDFWISYKSLTYKMFLAIIFSSAFIYTLWCLGKDEPFVWLQGISMWPTELIRLFALLLGIIFIFKVIQKLDESKNELTGRFFQDFKLDTEDGKWTNILSNFLDITVVPWKKIKNEKILNNNGELKAVELWKWYCIGTSHKSQWIWILISMSLLFILGIELRQMFGIPNVPYRGEAYILDNLVLWPCVIVFSFLILQSYHTTQFNSQVISQLSHHISRWPKKTLQFYALRQKDIPPNNNNDEYSVEDHSMSTLCKKLRAKECYFLDESIDIYFISELTKLTGNIVYYPFVILTLMIFARSRIFDDWNNTPSIVLIFLLCGWLSLFSILCLRRSVRDAKTKIVGQLNTMLKNLAIEEGDEARNLEKQTQKAIEEIVSNRKGAFMPLAQEPAVQAILLPVGGWGGQALLQYFVLLGI